MEKTKVERFWSKVDRTEGENACWPWKAGTQRGYGCYSVDGKGHKSHKLAWSLHHGRAWPEGKFGCHTCDNPICCNPIHVWPGTHTENMLDCIRKGRHNRARLLPSQVAYIRLLHERGGATRREMAEAYGVKPDMIYRITSGRMWKDVEPATFIAAPANDNEKVG